MPDGLAVLMVGISIEAVILIKVCRTPQQRRVILGAFALLLLVAVVVYLGIALTVLWAASQAS